MMFNPQFVEEWPIFKTLLEATSAKGIFRKEDYDNDPTCYIQVYMYSWINKQYAQGMFLTLIYGTLFSIIAVYVYLWTWPEFIRLVGAPLAEDYTRYNVQQSAGDTWSYYI